tara:strand:- start:327 stop:464 length:138 start_codon:yes stop_codon:yes gene_type:complete
MKEYLPALAFLLKLSIPLAILSFVYYNYIGHGRRYWNLKEKMKGG